MKNHKNTNYFLRKWGTFLYFFLIIITNTERLLAQEHARQIEVVYAGTLTIDEEKYPKATIFNADNDRKVQFRHQGLDLWCDIAVLYTAENKVKAYGEVFLQQGDSLKMNCNSIVYDGQTKIALAKENVVLRNDEMTLKTNELYFDRNTQEAYYNTSGTITDPKNTLTSLEGKYFVQIKKNQFKNQVKIINDNTEIQSSMLDYYHTSGHLYMFDNTKITGADYKIITAQGFYDTKNEQGYFKKNTQIYYDNKVFKGDSLYFNKTLEFASATNNIRVKDSLHHVLVKGHYGEFHKAKDSLFVTHNALVARKMENDSIYFHGDKIILTGKKDDRILKAFPRTRFFKKDLQGKSDSLWASEKLGLMRLVGKPIIWSGNNQLSGDNIHLISNLETKALDSLKVFNNVFIAEKDTLGSGFNQTKGKILKGFFTENKLKIVNIYQNTEMIYYAYNDQNQLVGINLLKCSQIQLNFNKEQQIDKISFINNVEGKIFPEDKLSKHERIFPNFEWRGDERINSVSKIFFTTHLPQPIKPMNTPEENDQNQKLWRDENF